MTLKFQGNQNNGSYEHNFDLLLNHQSGLYFKTKTCWCDECRKQHTLLVDNYAYHILI